MIQTNDDFHQVRYFLRLGNVMTVTKYPKITMCAAEVMKAKNVLCPPGAIETPIQITIGIVAW